MISTNSRYIKQEPMVLKLKEKYFCWSGDDATVKDLSKNVWFKIDAETLSMSSKRTMMDAEGKIIAGYRKKLLSLYATAYITKEVEGKTLVYATVKKESMMSFVASAEIFIHNPPMDLDSVTTDGLAPQIRVEGDFMAKKYDFMMGSRDNPYKVAQVVRKWLTTYENNCYFINIGTNIDIAFICMAAMAIDELFTEGN